MKKFPASLSRLLASAGVLFLLSPMWANANGETVLPLSLNQARELAVRQSVMTRRARLDVEAADKQARETLATGLPQVNASVGYNYYLDIPTSLIPAEFLGGQPGELAEIRFGTEQTLTATASVNQLVFSGEYLVGLRAARIYRDLAAKNLERTALEVKNMVTETYLLALMAKENLGIVSVNLSNMQQTLHETRQIMEAGFTDPINVDQLQLAVANMQHTLYALERQKKLTINLLKFQSGIPLDTEILLTDELEPLLTSLVLEAARAETFDPARHIDYQVMASQENFNAMLLRREQSLFLPSVSASFTRQEMAMRNEFSFFQAGKSWFPSTFFGLNLNIPIFSSGMRSSRVRQARIELEKARLAREETAESLHLQMQEARDAFATALDQYQNQQGNLELARRIFQRTRIMHREGLATSLELTQANDQLLTTQSQYLQAMFDLLHAKNNLDKALGRP